MAEKFRCTLFELGQRFSASEYHLWLAYYQLQNREANGEPLTVEDEIAQMKRVLN